MHARTTRQPLTPVLMLVAAGRFSLFGSVRLHSLTKTGIQSGLTGKRLLFWPGLKSILAFLGTAYAFAIALTLFIEERGQFGRAFSGRGPAPIAIKVVRIDPGKSVVSPAIASGRALPKTLSSA